MKKMKFVPTMIALLFVFLASNAVALPVPIEIEPISFNLVLGEQGLLYSNSAPNTYVSTINSVRLTDKDLLNFLADAFHTNWPAGAQFALVAHLVLANGSNVLPSHDTDIFIVDKTGTNLLFDASTGINLGETNIAFFSFDYDSPVVTGKSVTSPPFQDQTTVQMVTFRLYYINGRNFTSLNFQGLDISKSNYDEHTRNYTITDNANLYGDGNFNNGPWSVVSGEMSGAFRQSGVVFESGASPAPVTGR